MDPFLQRVIEQRDRETDLRTSLEIRISKVGKPTCEVCGDLTEDGTERCFDCKDLVDFQPHQEPLIPVPDGFVPRDLNKLFCGNCGDELKKYHDKDGNHFCSKPECSQARRRWEKEERRKKLMAYQGSLTGECDNYVKCIVCNYVWPSRLPKGRVPKTCPICGPKPPPENGESMIMPTEEPGIPPFPEMTRFSEPDKLQETPGSVETPKEATPEVQLPGDQMQHTKPTVRYCPLDDTKLRSNNSTGWCWKHINPVTLRLKPEAYAQARKKGVKVPEQLKPEGVEYAADVSGNKDKQGATPAPEPTVRSKQDKPGTPQGTDVTLLVQGLLQQAQECEAQAKSLNEKAAQFYKTVEMLTKG